MHFVAEHLSQRSLQQVRRGVQLCGCLAVVGKTALEALLRARMTVFLMLLEALLEALNVDLDALFARELAGDLDREAVGVVELERAAAVDAFRRF